MVYPGMHDPVTGERITKDEKQQKSIVNLVRRQMGGVIDSDCDYGDSHSGCDPLSRLCLTELGSDPLGLYWEPEIGRAHV